MQNLNIAVNDRVWPDFDVRRMSNWGTVYITLKHLPLGWCGQNMKAKSYMLQQLDTFQNLNTALNGNIQPDLDLGRRSYWGRGVYYWKVLP